MRIALFVPCFVDQLYPGVAIAALRVLERLGVAVDVPSGAACCGQPAANAGFEDNSRGAIDRFVETFEPYDRIVMLSGSCALHVRRHATGGVASKAVEFTGFLHDDVGVERIAKLGRRMNRRVAVHIGCHGLRGLGLAKPTEVQTPQPDKVRAVLGAIDGVSFADLARPDECCGFGGTFAIGEAAVSAKMGRDRLRDYSLHRAEAVVSTDPSCMMHLAGLARAEGNAMPFMHVAELLALAFA
jgi:L-lactate dehydrogenase complex protein LldE